MDRHEWIDRHTQQEFAVTIGRTFVDGEPVTRESVFNVTSSARSEILRLSSQVQSLTLEVEGLRGREEKLVKVIVGNAVPLEVLNMVAVEDQGRRYLSHKLMQSVKDACERSRIVAVEWNSRNALQGSVGETVCEECDEGWVAKDYEEAGIYIERCPKCQGDSQ